MPRPAPPTRAARRLGRALAGCVLLFLAAVTAAAAALAQDPGWIEMQDLGRVGKRDLREVYVVGARTLNLRPDPSTANPPLATLVLGDVVRRVAETFNTTENRSWLRVVLPDGGTGWVAAGLVEPVAPALDRVEQALRLVRGTSPAAAGNGPGPPRRGPVESVRAGFVYVGPVGDAGWTYSHDQGRKALESLPFMKETMVADSVPEDPRLVAEAIDALVARGANLIFTTSFGFMDPTIDAARRYPAVTFMHCSGYKTADNAGTYFGREYEGRYLAGMLAGGMTESGRIGYVAAFPIPEVVRGINAFALGALAVNPDVEVRVLWTSTWYSPGIERETAERLLDYGADVLTMHQDTPATAQAAEQRGKYALGYHSDMSMFAPRAVLTSSVWDWAPIYTKVATDLHEGRWEPYQLWWGLKEGVVRLAPLSGDLPDSLAQRVARAEGDLRDGRLRVFEGPLRDGQGVVRVPSGRVLTDAELLTMDYFVLGVKGELPAPQTPAVAAN
jgi:basic membrane protein A